DRPARGDARKLGVFDDGFAIELDRKAVALHGDEHAVPLAYRRVGIHLGRDAGADFGRHLLIHAVAVDFAGADRPAPEVDLALAIVSQRHALGPPVSNVPFVSFPVRQIQTGVEALEAPVHVGNLTRLGIGARQLLDLDVFEPAFGSFGFESEVAFARVALADA